MAQVDAPVTASVAPSGEPLPPQRIASPDAFGAQIGSALGSASQGLAQNAEATAGLQQEALAKDADIKLNDGLMDMQFNPQTGFMTKQGKAAVDAFPDIQAKSQALYQQVRDSLPSPLAQKMFDDSAIRSLRYSVSSMASHAGQQNLAWIDSTATARITNQINQGAAFWNDDNHFAQSIATIKGEVADLGQTKGWSPEEVQANTQHYTSEAWMQRINATMASDPNAAEKMYQANQNQIDAAHQAVIGPRIEQHQYMEMSRSIALQAHQDVMAERQLRQAQDGTFAHQYAQLLSGTPPTANDLAPLVDAKTLRPDQASFLLSNATVKKEDNQSVLFGLTNQVTSGLATADDIQKHIEAGEISAPTGLSLVEKANALAKETNNKEYTSGLSQVNTMLGAPQFEQSYSYDPGAKQGAKDAQAQLITSARAEYSTRVLQNHENPQTVVDDMRPRYVKQAVQLPAAYPQPRLGPVNTLEDVQRVGGLTYQAYQQGKITKQIYDQEVVNLNNLRKAYVAQQSVIVQNAGIGAVKTSNNSGNQSAKPASTPTSNVYDAEQMMPP